MSEICFQVNLSPRDALNTLIREEDADLIHKELKNLTDGHSFGVLVFEKYFMRVKNKAALVVIADDTSGTTDIRAIATGSSESVLFNLDWGAADDFASSVKDILKKYIIG